MQSCHEGPNLRHTGPKPCHKDLTLGIQDLGLAVKNQTLEARTTAAYHIVSVPVTHVRLTLCRM